MSVVSESTMSNESSSNPIPPTQTGEYQNLQPSFKLNGRNYIVWSQIVRTFLKGKGKLSHLTGPIPREDDPSFAAWDVEDSSIMSWLWNSMQPEISGTCMFLTTAKDIWDTIKQMYSKVHDAALVYEIKTKIHSTKQGLSVTDYYNKMKILWLELDYYHNIKMKCSDDAAMMLKFVQGERVYEFLAGLNVEHDQIFGQQRKPLLQPLQEIRTHKRKLLEATRKGATRNNHQMQSQPGNHQANVVQGQQKDVTTAEIQEINGLNREEIEKLRSFLTIIDKPIGSCSMAQSGNKKIKTADGTLISIAGKGTVKPTPTMTLHSVLHVPKLSVNLLSIKQDLKTGKMIGHAKEEDGVYYLDTNSGGLRSSFLSKAYLSLTLSANKAQIWLHHVQMGHPSFALIKTMFPFLFKNLNVNEFNCEMILTQFGVCIKHIRSDNGTEYFNQVMSPFLTTKGIIHESSCIATPQQNGIAERKNHHLLEITRALLFEKKVPKFYWGEAVCTAAYLINRLPSRVLQGRSPIDVLSEHFPDLKHSSLPLKTFGCVSYVHIQQKDQLSKLDPRALKTIFLGYSSTQKGYKCYHPSSRKTYVSKHVTFLENQGFYDQVCVPRESSIDDNTLEFLSFDLSTPNQPTPTQTPETQPVNLKETQSQPESISSPPDHHPTKSTETDSK
ncbi:uncharacterized protein LOC128132928 [Lactuca sativa]|uniref:uncharacterized protein LOC128132928 n=1 Tax=Lactuca sativa TaxID=4236 RepID=UPI0022AFB82D|nr:uncharacterized protein LOC128132928 [Lactuca sativa]